MNKKLQLEDEMDKFIRSLGNLRALIHSLSLTAVSMDIGQEELARAIEATWELSGFLEQELVKIRTITPHLQTKDIEKN